jgi:prefoldin subunit 5
MENVQLIKEVYGLNTYTTAVDTQFSELLQPAPEVTASFVTIEQFFSYYDELFFQIPVSGSINSHTYLVERSQQYIGGSVIDAEKQALIEEINSLRQQLLDLNQSFTSINDIL